MRAPPRSGDMKRLSDLTPYVNVLPYASEIFGVYQPMIGWRSKRTSRRIKSGFARDLSAAHRRLYHQFDAQFEVALQNDRAAATIAKLQPAVAGGGARSIESGSFVVDAIAKRLPPLDQYSDAVWDQVLQPAALQETLTKAVVPRLTEWYRTTAQEEKRTARQGHDSAGELSMQLARESSLAGYLLYLREHKQAAKLKQLFYRDTSLGQLTRLFDFKDPLDLMDPFKDIDRVSLSPIGIVHLFRQYFFEFDTFLGTPVSHVWLSPGASVELVEVSSRRTVTERTVETSLDTTIRTERSVTDEDEISDAVKDENRSDIKFGVSTTANQSWPMGSASATGNIDMSTSQSKARESTHRHMRQQTEKLSTEIRKNFKSTFKTATETSDTSSKRYVLANSTNGLINYELRRKMRQVGVQIHDIGTYLCWQTFVDDPGRDLGVAKLVHLAKAPDMSSVPPPEQIPMPQPITMEKEIDIPFVQVSESRGDLDEGYKHGKEADEDTTEGDREEIEADFKGYTVVCEQPGYEFGSLEWDYRGNDVRLSLRNKDASTPGTYKFDIHLDWVNFKGNSPIRVAAKVHWLPTKESIDSATAENDKKRSEFNEKSRYEHERAYVEAARDRINKAGEVRARKFEDLREEERIVVYRRLIQSMLSNDIPMPDDHTRHVVSELLNSIFDIDKMLYFVAPEWWRPRLHVSHQSLGGVRELPGTDSDGAAKRSLADTVAGKMTAGAAKNLLKKAPALKDEEQVAPIDTVSWGGVEAGRRDNYYVTETSEPARLGSSLGWLLQLDGDNLRNAFLNAPWVKAVIPIRPGKERAAMNWLQRLHVEGTDGLDDRYVAPQDQLAQIPHNGPNVTVRDAIEHLCDQVSTKHAQSNTVGRYPTDETNDDNRVSATPVDKVYEHGFYPLQGGFRVAPGGEAFEVFDQWVEVLPTDQVVPVEVSYDPKTGRQV